MDDLTKLLITFGICITICLVSFLGFWHFSEKNFVENGYEQVMGVGHMTPIWQKVKRCQHD